MPSKYQLPGFAAFPLSRRESRKVRAWLHHPRFQLRILINIYSQIFDLLFGALPWVIRRINLIRVDPKHFPIQFAHDLSSLLLFRFIALLRGSTAGRGLGSGIARELRQAGEGWTRNPHAYVGDGGLRPSEAAPGSARAWKAPAPSRRRGQGQPRE